MGKSAPQKSFRASFHSLFWGSGSVGLTWWRRWRHDGGGNKFSFYYPGGGQSRERRGDGGYFVGGLMYHQPTNRQKCFLRKYGSNNMSPKIEIKRLLHATFSQLTHQDQFSSRPTPPIIILYFCLSSPPPPHPQGSRKQYFLFPLSLGEREKQRGKGGGGGGRGNGWQSKNLLLLHTGRHLVGMIFAQFWFTN